MTLELRCSRELALWLGASAPETAAQYRQLRDAGHMLVRDRIGWPMFWPVQLSCADVIAARSS